MRAREPQIGDVFAVRGRGVVGRVVSTGAVVGPTHGSILVYLYRDARHLSRAALLVPPLMTTRAPWSHGLFTFVRSEPLLPGGYFERHAFRNAHGALFDEEGRPLEGPLEGVPTGELRLLDVESIEAAVDEALRQAPPPAAGGEDIESPGGPEGYAIEPRAPSVDEYRHLRDETGLSPKSPEAARLGLAGTWFGVTVRARGGEAVGMGRIVGDGGCFFQVVDIAVLPSHQRRGLGKWIMAALMGHLRAHAPASAYVSLLADGEAKRLYEQFGFRDTAPQSVGMALKL